MTVRSRAFFYVYIYISFCYLRRILFIKLVVTFPRDRERSLKRALEKTVSRRTIIR